MRHATILVTLLTLAACSDDNVAPGPGGGVTGASSGNPGPPDSGTADSATETKDGGTIGAQDFSLEVMDATVIQPRSVDILVKITRGSGFTGAVNVTLSGLPTDVGAAATTLAIAAGTDSGTFKLTAGATSPQGSAKLKLDAKSADGKISKSKDFNLLVRGAPGTLDKTYGAAKDGRAVVPISGAVPPWLFVNAAGIAYISGGYYRVSKLKADGSVDTTFGTAGVAGLGDDTQAAAVFESAAGDVYVRTGSNSITYPNKIRKVSAAGVLSATAFVEGTQSFYDLFADATSVRAGSPKTTTPGVGASITTQGGLTVFDPTTGAVTQKVVVDAFVVNDAASTGDGGFWFAGLDAGNGFPKAVYVSPTLVKQNTYTATEFAGFAAIRSAPDGSGILLFGSNTVRGFSKVKKDGTLDTSFGISGTAIGFPSFIRGWAMDTAGRLVVSNSGDNSDDGTTKVYRYLATGAPDPDFGAGGSVTLGSGNVVSGNWPRVVGDRISVLANEGGKPVVYRLWY
jgi:hypothetical protein